MMWDDSDRMVWFKTAVIVLMIALGFANGTRAQDFDADDYDPDKKIYLIKDISTGSSIQPVFIYRSGDLWFYRNLQTGEGFKTLWVK